LLERFALGEKADARFGTLSTGQRQRLSGRSRCQPPRGRRARRAVAGPRPAGAQRIARELAGLKARAARCCSRHTICPRRKNCATASRFSTAGASFAIGTPRELGRGATFESAFLKLVSTPQEDTRR